MSCSADGHGKDLRALAKGSLTMGRPACLPAKAQMNPLNAIAGLYYPENSFIRLARTSSCITRIHSSRHIATIPPVPPNDRLPLCACSPKGSCARRSCVALSRMLLDRMSRASASGVMRPRPPILLVLVQEQGGGQPGTCISDDERGGEGTSNSLNHVMKGASSDDC